MPAYDFNMNKAGFAALQAAPASSATPAVAAATNSGGGFSLQTAFHDLLEIVNPLQHLPVVGTIYRAITHDAIDPVEKIAGDALYGGMWGAIGSVADLAFEKATGKDFGATVLAFLTGDGDKPVAFAATTPPASVNAPASSAGVTALITANASRQATVASTTPAISAITPAAQTPTQAPGADVVALSNSLSAKGVDGTLSARALFAYQQSQSLGKNPQVSSLVAVN